MIKLLVLIVTLMCIANSINLVYYSSLPVSRLALFKALLSMNYLKQDLDSTFNTRFQNKFAYYVRTKLTTGYLTDVSNQLKQYNNVLVGTNNGVAGKNNLMVGDGNHVVGSDNWIFSQGYNGQADKDIILDKWQIQSDKADQIIVDPHLAIKQW